MLYTVALIVDLPDCRSFSLVLREMISRFKDESGTCLIAKYNILVCMFT